MDVGRLQLGALLYRLLPSRYFLSLRSYLICPSWQTMRLCSWERGGLYRLHQRHPHSLVQKFHANFLIRSPCKPDSYGALFPSQERRRVTLAGRLRACAIAILRHPRIFGNWYIKRTIRVSSDLATHKGAVKTRPRIGTPVLRPDSDHR